MRLDNLTLYTGNAIDELKNIEDGTVNTCITSPPYYGLRDYGAEGQIGLEQTPEQFISKLADVFDEVHRVLRDDGTLWVNIGDSYWGGGWRGSKIYAGEIQKSNKGSHCGENVKVATGKHELYKPKDLIGIPWMFAFEMRRRGWWLRQDIIWHKPAPMPESCTDRCTKSHEYIFLFSKSQQYYYDHEAIKEDSVDPESHKGINKRSPQSFTEEKFSDTRKGFANLSGKKYPKRNKRSVWCVNTASLKEAHFAVYPLELIEPCVLAGAPEGGIVLDPFFGSGTTAIAAMKNGRKAIGVELNPEYIEIAKKRIREYEAPEVIVREKGFWTVG